MNNFHYTRATDTASALQQASSSPGDQGILFIAGGTNLVDLMREGIMHPAAVVDLTRLPLDSISEHEGGIRIGAMVRNSHLAANELIRERYPLLSEAILAGASAQLRNMATTGGNLMQRTRCYYFYDGASRCNKRSPGSGCDALEGFNRIHAILGASEHCIATHPSDMCVALCALDAVVNVEGTKGRRSIPIREFHRLPGDTPDRDTNLEPRELITSVDLPGGTSGMPSRYRKVRDRASYAFALCSVAAAVKIENGKLAKVQIALGGVAHKPWRAETAEKILAGSPPSEELFERAAAAELSAAVPRRDNAFKIELAKRTIADVLSELTSEMASTR
jgi:xanthine dehydrogenase YagS FAD-binding subunit